MFKPLTLSLSLAVAFGACSVSMAGHFASPQGPSPQCAPSAQCETVCAPKKKCCFKLPHISLPKPTHTYEWVLKKKTVWTHGSKGCETGIHPTSQCAPSAQTYGSSQVAYPTTYGSGQLYGATYGTSQYGSGQATAPTSAGQMSAPPAAPSGDEPPVAPEVAPAAPSAPSTNPEPPAAPPGPQSSLLFSTPSGN